ncbi:MAG: acetyl-CoA C-acetyltransferase [bacterium]|nr:acetyl-CoA C-acetyltransferase [bacterium]
MAENVYIVDYQRVAFSRSRPAEPEKDVYNKISMPAALGQLLKLLVQRTKIDPMEIGDVLVGCTMQMGEQFTFGGRTPVFLADFPYQVPSEATDRVCTSGMSCIHRGVMEIMTGYSEICLAGGMEHMSHLALQPDYNPHMGFAPELMNPHFGTKYDLMTALTMGLTAEKLYEECKAKFGVTREEMDRFGVRSHNLAEKAIAEGYFKGEIMPLEVEKEDGTKVVISEDQAVRKGATYESTASLKPAFRPDGGVTAGNSSPLNAGASAVMLMSEKAMKKYKLEPMARIVSMGWAGVEPNMMGKGPVPSSEIALKHAKLSVKDINYWEINEAFAIVPIYAMRMLKIEEEKVNIKGGGTAIGHALAASGPRITGTLARILKEKKAKYGIATLCGGGGQGTATLIERV